MRRNSGYLVGCFGAAFAIASFLIGLEVSSTTAAPSVDPAASSVNRTLKGDRMLLVPGTSRNAVNGPSQIKAPTAELLDGCEPVISSIGQTPLAKIAGRCVS
jgi:hypothetical protein